MGDTAGKLHAAEPWSAPVFEGEGGPDEGWWIYNGKSGIEQYAVAVTLPYSSTSEADARRIVACVNACTGISTGALEAMPINASYMDRVRERDELQQRCNQMAEGIGRMSAEFLHAQKVVQAQRDELLAAVKLIADQDLGYIDGFVDRGQITRSSILALRSVISKIEGAASGS
jgi:hypothetical protein